MCTRLISLHAVGHRYAGVDAIFNSPYFRQEIAEGTLPSWRLSRFAGKFGPPIAEWTIGMIIARERKFKLMAADLRPSTSGPGTVLWARTASSQS